MGKKNWRLNDHLNPEFCEFVCRQPYLGARTIILSFNRLLGKSGVYWYSLQPRGSPFSVVVEHTNFVSPDAFAGEHIIYLGEYLNPESHE